MQFNIDPLASLVHVLTDAQYSTSHAWNRRACAVRVLGPRLRPSRVPTCTAASWSHVQCKRRVEGEVRACHNGAQTSLVHVLTDAQYSTSHARHAECNSLFCCSELQYWSYLDLERLHAWACLKICLTCATKVTTGFQRANI